MSDEKNDPDFAALPFRFRVLTYPVLAKINSGRMQSIIALSRSISVTSPTRLGCLQKWRGHFRVTYSPGIGVYELHNHETFRMSGGT